MSKILIAIIFLITTCFSSSVNILLPVGQKIFIQVGIIEKKFEVDVPVLIKTTKKKLQRKNSPDLYPFLKSRCFRHYRIRVSDGGYKFA